ncbi:MAG: hypothetical protein ABIJ21_02985 [Nanoarchaeota archaeon]
MNVALPVHSTGYFRLKANSQIRTSGNKVWITWIGERLDILEERGLNIPIMKDIDSLREKFFGDFEKSHAEK